MSDVSAAASCDYLHYSAASCDYLYKTMLRKNVAAGKGNSQSNKQK